MEHSNLSPLDISGPAHVVSERWRKWRRSFHFYVTGKGLRDPPQLRALLLHLAGEAVQDVYESLNLTFSAGEDVYVRTLAELDKQFEVKANQPYERHVFRQMVQQPNETVAQFVTKLKTQAQFCNFQDHDDQIRDQLLHAMADMELREKLLETDQLTLSIAMENQDNGKQLQHKQRQCPQAPFTECVTNADSPNTGIPRQSRSHLLQLSAVRRNQQIAHQLQLELRARCRMGRGKDLARATRVAWKDTLPKIQAVLRLENVAVSVATKIIWLLFAKRKLLLCTNYESRLIVRRWTCQQRRKTTALSTRFL